MFDSKDSHRIKASLILPEELINECEGWALVNDCCRNLVAEAALRYALNNFEAWQHDFYALLMEARDSQGDYLDRGEKYKAKRRKTKPRR